MARKEKRNILWFLGLSHLQKMGYEPRLARYFAVWRIRCAPSRQGPPSPIHWRPGRKAIRNLGAST